MLTMTISPSVVHAQPLIAHNTTTQAPVHTSSYWLSLWYASHPQYSPTQAAIQIMRADPQSVVPGYTIPLTAATPAPVHTSSYWLSLWYASHPQYSPTQAAIQIMRADPQSVVPAYKIPLTTGTHAAVPNNLTTSLKVDNNTYQINYQITGDGNKLNGISLEKDKSRLLANISSTSGGVLIIELPRNIIDSKNRGTNIDDVYQVYNHGQYITFGQVMSNTKVRILAIPFSKSSQIEIAGTHAGPDFGTVGRKS